MSTTQNIATNYAYVFLVFGGDGYIIGAVTAAYSLITTNTKHDIVCMVTDDVSQEAISEMHKLNIKTILIPYLEYKTKPLITKRQRDLYSSWIDKSFTKWNCLSLIQYEKILFLDADLIVLKNIDHIFNETAPMGIFENRYDELLTKKGIKNFYRRSIKQSKFKEVIHPYSINKALLNRGFVFTGNCVLLEPNIQQYEDYKKMMNDETEPFGFNCMSGYDEQSLSYYISVYKNGPKLKWKNLTSYYGFILWHFLEKNPYLKNNTKHQLENNSDLKKTFVMDFFGEHKPWNQTRGTYVDLEYWYDMVKKMYHNNPSVKLDFKYKADLC